MLSDPIQSSPVRSIFCRCHIVTSLKVILGIFGNLRIHSVILGHFGSLQVVLGHCRSFQVVLGHFRSFLVLVTTLEDGTCFKFFCQPKFSFCCIIYVFRLEQYNTKIYLFIPRLKAKVIMIGCKPSCILFWEVKSNDLCCKAVCLFAVK